MPLIPSKVNLRDPLFAENRRANQALADDLRARVQRVKQGGGEAARDRHLRRGKLLPRERVRRLLDSGSPFLELSQLPADRKSDVSGKSVSVRVHSGGTRLIKQKK